MKTTKNILLIFGLQIILSAMALSVINTAGITVFYYILFATLSATGLVKALDALFEHHMEQRDKKVRLHIKY